MVLVGWGDMGAATTMALLLRSWLVGLSFVCCGLGASGFGSRTGGFPVSDIAVLRELLWCWGELRLSTEPRGPRLANLAQQGQQP